MADGAHPESIAPAILIVDDHEVVRAALRDWLCTLFPDYRVWETSSGEAAVALAAARQPTIVVMDISLPGMSGIEATRRIKGAHSSVMVVILTIHEEQFYQDQARAAGADAYVFKRNMETRLVPALKRLMAREPVEADRSPTIGAG